MSTPSFTFPSFSAPAPAPEIFDQLKLNEQQTVAFEQTLKVLTHHFAIQNTSIMGAGKTYWTAALSIALELPLLIVCPKLVVSVWDKIISDYGLKYIDVICYSTFSGRKQGGCNHGYLSRTGDVFTPSSQLEKAVNEGILFVMDESHKTKNATAKNLPACHAIVNLIGRKFKENKGRSRVISLSGTPGDSKKHAESICKIQGFTSQKELIKYDPSTQSHILLGLQEIGEIAYKVNPEKTMEFMRAKMSAANAKLIVFNLYTQILKDVYAIDMPLPPPKVKQYLHSGHFQYLPQDAVLSAAGEKLIKENVQFKNGQWITKKGKKTLESIIKALQLIEWAKLNICVRKGMDLLRNDPNGKLVIFAWSIEAMEYLRDQFSDFRVDVLNGQISPEAQLSIASRFQKADHDIQVLIVNPEVAAQGISLDDRSEGGLFKRYFLIIPHYKFTLMEQAFGRFYRVSTTSDSYGWIIFSNEFMEEQAILQSVFSKSEDCTMFLAGGRKVGLNNNTPKEMEEKHQVSFRPKSSTHMSNAVKDYYDNARYANNQYQNGYQASFQQTPFQQTPFQQTPFQQPQYQQPQYNAPAMSPQQPNFAQPNFSQPQFPQAQTPPQFAQPNFGQPQFPQAQSQFPQPGFPQPTFRV